ncbi:MAG: dTDP-4-dehydrorhamnose 3,5-epimerase family protein [Paenibacillaceae bacterium]|nr:dTDP-4-dehydrorhamnose 3,5-epimerase family protein [Paenibacillaceae bacterium]
MKEVFETALEKGLQVRPLGLPGCYALVVPVFRDRRGSFVKTVRRDFFDRLGLDWRFPEQFYSRSRKGVLRGLHFQLPPMSQAKLIVCIQGEVLDALVDLRADSPAYGSHATVSMCEDDGTMIYMPAGIAHGFYAIRDAVLHYHVSAPYSPPHDSGIRWDTAGIEWPEDQPLLSERDAGLPALDRFASPFRMRESNTGDEVE